MSFKQNNHRTIRAWCTYDWANSVYSLVITSAIFPIYYQAVTTTEGNDQVLFAGFTVTNSVLYSFALSFSFLVISPLLPLLSGVADYAGSKKSFMKFFCYLGGFACMGMYFFTSSSLEWGILCVVLASIGYSGSLVFYDAYLPEIATSDQLDKVSAKGYSWGYYGGVVLLILNLVFIQNFEVFGFPSQGIATRFSFLLVGIWWIGFAQIPFAILPDNVYKKDIRQAKWSKGYEELVKVWHSLKSNPDLKKYILAYFFFNMGVQTVMYMAATFGSKELKLPDFKLIATVLIIQLVASLGAFVFARLSGKWGNKSTLIVMISIWILICLAAYMVTSEYEFYALATAVGVVMGGIQSLSRATYAKLIPKNSIDHASYFSFFDVAFNLSIVVGTFSYGLVEQLTGSMRNSTLAIGGFFVIGLFLLRNVNATSISESK
ncbi:MAG: MFS transporter [Cytophagales bacterium]|nr:MFS transporter [Cytophagales bacterium]MCA6365788.1 MFS transporter [Cytophagales bacterium]MCA6373617.1 MFS transporter [Cytophagales bacterium]MCA6376923.1 MFS transporter [Cytophagales bacterium]MCA6385608.1 MFS transporter [Cytophagales bacterium]